MKKHLRNPTEQSVHLIEGYSVEMILFLIGNVIDHLGYNRLVRFIQ